MYVLVGYNLMSSSYKKNVSKKSNILFTFFEEIIWEINYELKKKQKLKKNTPKHLKRTWENILRSIRYQIKQIKISSS